MMTNTSERVGTTNEEPISQRIGVPIITKDVTVFIALIN